MASLQMNKMSLYEDEDDEGDEGDAVKTTKRRSKPKAKTRKQAKKVADNQGEYFDLDGQAGGEAEDDVDEVVMDHRLGFYQGEEKKLITRGVFYMRLFLLSMDAFPTKDALAKWADKSFSASCQIAYGINYKGLSSTSTSFSEHH